MVNRIPWLFKSSRMNKPWDCGRPHDQKNIGEPVRGAEGFDTFQLRDHGRHGPEMIGTTAVIQRLDLKMYDVETCWNGAKTSFPNLVTCERSKSPQGCKDFYSMPKLYCVPGFLKRMSDWNIDWIFGSTWSNLWARTVPPPVLNLQSKDR